MTKDEARMELNDFMCQLSDEYFSAGWHSDLEYYLWAAVQGNLGRINQKDADLLRKLHEEAGGWFHFPEGVVEEVFVPTAEWLQIYARRGIT